MAKSGSLVRRHGPRNHDTYELGDGSLAMIATDCGTTLLLLCAYKFTCVRAPSAETAAVRGHIFWA